MKWSNPKELVRLQLLQQRTLLTVDERNSSSEKVLEKVKSIIADRHPHSIHCYTPIYRSNEIDTRHLIGYIKQLDGITMTIGKTLPQTAIPDEQFDMIIVPVVGYNDKNYRIGYGGGWYDRFLKRQLHTFSIGLAYKESLVTFTPEPHDQRLDLIITD